MKKLVFLSHSSKDAQIAQLICSNLEEKNLSCWFAPRDIPSGEAYPKEIVTAIQDSKIFIFLLSANSNSSEHVMRELDRACTYKKPILTIRLNDIKPNAGLEYFLSQSQWIDTFNINLEKELAHIADAITLKLNPDKSPKSQGDDFDLIFSNEFEWGHGNFNCCAITPNSDKIAIAKGPEFVVYNFDDFSVLNSNLFGHKSYIESMAFLGHGNELITSAADRIVHWDLAEEEIMKVNPRVTGSTYRGFKLDISRSILLEYIWKSDSNQFVQLYDFKLLTPTLKLEKNKPTAADIHPSGKFIIGGYYDGEIKVFSIKDGTQLETKPMFETNNIRHIKYSPCGNFFITHAENWGKEDLKIWSCSKWKCIKRIILKTPYAKVQDMKFIPSKNQLIVFQDKLFSIYKY